MHPQHVVLRPECDISDTVYQPAVVGYALLAAAVLSVTSHIYISLPVQDGVSHSSVEVFCQSSALHPESLLDAYYGGTIRFALLTVEHWQLDRWASYHWFVLVWSVAVSNVKLMRHQPLLNDSVSLGLAPPWCLRDGTVAVRFSGKLLRSLPVLQAVCCGMVCRVA